MSITAKTSVLAGVFAIVVPLVAPAGLAHAAPANVVYRVLGPGTARINYEDGDGNDQIENDAALPWSKTAAFEKPAHIVLMVMAWGVTDPLTCTIEVNGVQVATKTQRQPLTCEADVQAG